MAIVDKHPPGSFCWIELVTTDQDAAKKFYNQLFGWAITDSPLGPDDFYTIFKIHSRHAAAAYTMRKDQRAQGVPAHWMLYIAVENADQAVAKAAKTGGVVISPAYEVGDAGRMAVLQDPTGAVFSIWQSKKSSGLGINGVDGALCWADLTTPGPDLAAKFYSNLFGWQFVPGEKDHSGYMHIKNGEDFIGGMPPARLYSGKVPAHWLIYFGMNDVKASAARAKQLGASIHIGPETKDRVGTLAVLADPQDAVFAIFKSARK